MNRTAIVIAVGLALATTLSAAPAQAQRVFVSGAGVDTNPCTFTSPCRSFAQAFATAPANGEIDVLDPAGYGPLTINKAISIQAHGFGGITATSGNAITITAGSSNAITLNGLLIDGANTGGIGIYITEAGSVQIVNCVIRHFNGDAISYEPTNTSANLLVSDTILSDNFDNGINIYTTGTTGPVTLSGITANNNAGYGVVAGNARVMIANSVVSNNATGLYTGDGGTIWLAKSAISGNTTGVNVAYGAVASYGDNDINGNGTDIAPTSGSLSNATTR